MPNYAENMIGVEVLCLRKVKMKNCVRGKP